MKVSAIIVTRGDVDIQPVIDSLPREWEVVVWDNGERMVTRSDGYAEVCTDLAVYGRYAAIEHATGDVIYVQDDDCIVSDPKTIVDTYKGLTLCPDCGEESTRADIMGQLGWACLTDKRFSPDVVVCNMPEPWRSNEFYQDHALVGFGGAFYLDAPKRAFDRLYVNRSIEAEVAWFNRTCDVAFTYLTPKVLVDVPHESMDYAWADNRMWKQPEHQPERDTMLQMLESIDG